MTISVVIPTYKASAFIQETLASVFAQTRPPDEIVVVDDCSPDDTIAVVEAIARSAPVPITVVRMPTNTGGPAGPLNRGIEIARGDLIATLDHDDLMIANKIESQLLCFEKFNKCGIVICKCRCRTDGSSPISLINAMHIFDSLARPDTNELFTTVDRFLAYEILHTKGNFAVSCSAFFFPKKIWKECRGFDERVKSGCDFTFLQELLTRYDLACVNLELYTWRRGVSNLTNVISNIVQLKEGVLIYSQFDVNNVASSRQAAASKQMNKILRSEVNGLAYCLSTRGKCLSAFYYYCLAIIKCGLNLESISGILKILPKALLSLLRRRS